MKAIYTKQVESLVKQGYTDFEGTEIIGCHLSTFRRIRNILGYKPSKRYPKIADIQKEVLVGTILGDGSLRKAGSNRLPLGKIEHSQKQLKYVEHKHKLLENLSCNIVKKSRYDKRTKKYYHSCYFQIKTHPYITELYNNFYPEGKRIIPFKLLEDVFTEISLSILFQDDGNKTRDNSYELSFMCFSYNQREDFRKFLYNKFGLETTNRKCGKIYIRRVSSENFKNLIEPYIAQGMTYKL